MGDTEEDYSGKGAVVEVPAGTYRVTLYRKDWDGMEEAGMRIFEDAEEAGIDVYGEGRVDEVIVLTPAPKPAKAPTNILFRDCLESDE